MHRWLCHVRLPPRFFRSASASSSDDESRRPFFFTTFRSGDEAADDDDDGERRCFLFPGAPLPEADRRAAGRAAGDGERDSEPADSGER